MAVLTDLGAMRGLRTDLGAMRGFRMALGMWRFVRCAQFPEDIHKDSESRRVQRAKEPAALAEGGADNKTVSQGKVFGNVLRVHTGTNQHRGVCNFFDAPQYRWFGRFCGAGPGDDEPVGKEKFGLFHLIGNVEIGG